MHEDLVDFRTKITETTSQVLDAHARADNSDKAEVARKVLAEWAAKEIHRSTLVARLTRGEGDTAGMSAAACGLNHGNA